MINKNVLKKKSLFSYKKATAMDDNEEKKRKQGPVNIKVFVYCFIATFILYMLIVAVEKAMVGRDERLPVYVATDEVPEKMLITEENVKDYFVIEERSAVTLPGSYITKESQLIGFITNETIHEREVAVAGSFVKEQSLIDKIVNPVEVSLNATNLAQVVGGVLRKGDYINIWSVKTTNKNGIQTVEAVMIYEGAYVTRAFTSAGEEVGRDAAKEASTTVINIVIPAEYEEAFNTAIAEGSVRLGRLYDTALVSESLYVEKASEEAADE